MKVKNVSYRDLNPELVSKHRKLRAQATRPTSSSHKKGTHKVSIKTNNKARCPYTGKIRYKDDQAAKAALRRTHSAAQIECEISGYSKRQEKRWFFCAMCSGNHLTSQSEVEYRSAYGKAA
jgi:hypothetical protein